VGVCSFIEIPVVGGGVSDGTLSSVVDVGYGSRVIIMEGVTLGLSCLFPGAEQAQTKMNRMLNGINFLVIEDSLWIFF
jgi:hypothetical protein